jgi:hypothetical protein
MGDNLIVAALKVFLWMLNGGQVFQVEIHKI